MFPAAAVADSGNITNIAPTGTGTIQATFTIDWTTCGYYDCGWWAVAYTRPIGSECLPDIGSIIWVGDLHTGPGHEETTRRSTRRTTRRSTSACTSRASATRTSCR